MCRLKTLLGEIEGQSDLGAAIVSVRFDSTKEHVSRFLPDSLTGLTKILSSLSRREAIFVGEAAALPARIKIRELRDDQLPNSADINFALGWMNDPLTERLIKNTTDKWLNI